MRTIYRSEPPWPHRVLVLGGGFAGVETARHLERLTRRRDDVEVWLVSRENFTLFTPLLPEVCSGMLEARHCVTALRAQLRQPSSWAVTGDVEEIDLDGKVVTVLGGDGDPHRLHYDTLVIALGGETATFGIKGITEYAVGMKTLADAFALRNRIIEMLERAELESDVDERQAQLTFVVGGAGFSGVETAGEIEDFIRRVRRRFYPKIRQGETRGHIVELKDRVLPEMPPDMGDYAARGLRKRGYEIHLGTPMKEVREGGVVIGDGDFIPARTVVWTGGVQPSPVVRASGIEVDKAGRAITEPTMETSRPGVWAIGDCAIIPDVQNPGGYHAPDRPERGARGEAVGPQHHGHHRPASGSGRAVPLPHHRDARQHRAPHRRRRRVRDQGPWPDRVVHVARLLLEPRAGDRRQGAGGARLGAQRRCSGRIRSSSRSTTSRRPGWAHPAGGVPRLDAPIRAPERSLDWPRCHEKSAATTSG